MIRTLLARDIGNVTLFADNKAGPGAGGRTPLQLTSTHFNSLQHTSTHFNSVQLSVRVSMTSYAYLVQIEGLFNQESQTWSDFWRIGRRDSALDGSDWSTGLRHHNFDTKLITEFNVHVAVQLKRGCVTASATLLSFNPRYAENGGAWAKALTVSKSIISSYVAFAHWCGWALHVNLLSVRCASNQAHPPELESWISR